MENRIKNKLLYLQEMAEKYNELNNKSKNQYAWRENAINESIEVLENLLNNVTGEWNECYEEDLQEFNKNSKAK